MEIKVEIEKIYDPNKKKNKMSIIEATFPTMVFTW